jgi:hypothetical protein
VIEKKIKLLPHQIEQEEEEYIPPPEPVNPVDTYRKKLNKMTVPQLINEYISVGVIQDKKELPSNITKDKLIPRLIHTFRKGLDL